jgi:peptidoglycan/xylan/chitin deacetylase (PgdA/CDA1 family)
MNRKIALFALAGVLMFAGCNKFKLPKFGKSKVAEPTPAPAVVATASPPAPASSAPPPVAEATKPEVNTHASVMVLCFHNIEDKSAMKALTISVAEFEHELQAVKEHGFSVIGMQDFLAWRRGEKDIPAKSCVITIDDGWVSGYTNAWPILKKYGYPFTLFIYVNYVGTGGKSLSWQQLEELRDAGVDIQSHTYSHSNLRSPGGGVDAKAKASILKDVQTLGREGWLRKEVIESKKVLEDRLGIKVNAFAYPFGIHTAEARAMAKEAGYEAAFTVYGQRLTHSSPWDLLGRYAVEAAKPVIFQSALSMIGGGVAPEDPLTSPATQLAATSMITQPMEGETISNPKPLLKANLATLGELDPNSVEMRVSGIGPVPVKFDPASKNAEAQVTQKLRDKSYTVIVSAKAKGGRKVEARWNFNFDPSGTPSEAGTAAPPAASGAAPASAQPAKKPKK